jgi:hypothetical protein
MSNPHLAMPSTSKYHTESENSFYTASTGTLFASFGVSGFPMAVTETTADVGM